MSCTRAHSTKAPLRKSGQRRVKVIVQKRKIFIYLFFSSFVCHNRCYNRVTPPYVWSFICQHLTVWYVWVQKHGLSDENPSKCSVWSHLTSPQRKWSYHYSEQDTVHSETLSAFWGIFSRCPPFCSFQILEETLIPVTIFWIFSSFFKMLDFTAQILSCWSLISCSSSASSTLRGSTALSVALQKYKQKFPKTQRFKIVHSTQQIEKFKKGAQAATSALLIAFDFR